MKIKFSSVIPAPIPEKDIFNSEIWSRDILFESPNKYLIFAESGKGKTTFINIIFGLRKDYSGNVFIDSENIRNLNLDKFAEIRKSQLSIVPQGLMLFNELSLINNIRIKNNITKHYSESKILEMIDLLGLTGLENRLASKLSFGQRQRVAIIRALCQNFSFILLDEAFSHLDDFNVKKAWTLILEEATKQNAGIILTSLKNKFIDNSLIKIKV